MPSERWQHATGYAAALITGACAGLLFAVNKQLTHTLSPLQVTWLEAFVALVVMLPPYLLRFRRDLWPRHTPWKWLLLFGLTAVMLFYCRTLGVALTNPTTGALIVRFEIVLVILYSYLFMAERLSAVAWMGAALLIAGMISALDLPQQHLVMKLGGITAFLLTALGIAGNSVVIKLHLGSVRSELTSVVNVVIQSAALGALLLSTGQFGGLWRSLAQPQVLGLVLLGGLLLPGMLLPYYYAMKRIPMWACRLLGLVTPVVAILADFFWLHSPISAGQLLGLALVTGGAALVILSGVAPASSREV